MAFPLKLLLGLIGLILTTVLGVIIYVSVIFDPNDYRDEISQAVAENTGRELTIEGAIDLNLFPWVGVSVSQLALSNAPDFGPKPMLEVGELEARLEIMPLLTDKAIRIGEVRLLDVAVRAATRGDKNNWDDLVAEDESTDEAETAERATEDESDHTIVIEAGSDEGEVEELDLAIAGITLKNIYVEFEQDGELTELQLDSLQTGPIRLGEPSTLLIELSASLPDDLSVATKLTSTWLVNPEGPIAKLDDLKLDATVAGPSVPGGKQTVRATGSAAYDGNTGEANIPALTLSSGELQATLEAMLRVEDAGPQGSVALKTNSFVAQNVAAGLGIPLGSPDSKPGPTQLDLGFSIRPNAIRSTRFSGQLDGAKLEGDMAIENFAAPRIRSNLNLAAFTLENWAPPTEDDEAATSQDTDGPDPMESELPLEMLKDLDLDITAKIGKFNGMGVQANNVLWTAFARPGQPFRQELSMNAYGGEIRMKNNVDARGSKPKTGMQLSLEAVGLGDLLKGTVGEAYITGLTQLSLDLTTAGSTLKSMLAGAVGSAQYSLKDGSVEGFSLLDLINASASKLSGDKAKTESSEKTETRFEELAGKLLFSGGRANAQNLSADSAYMALNGSGGFDLENLSWDLDLLPRLKDHPQISQQKHLKKLIGLDIPVSVTGPLMSPRFKLDVEGTLKAKAKQEIDKRKDELKTEAEDKAKKEIGRQLNRLFGNKKNKEEEKAQPEVEATPTPNESTP